MLPGFQLAAVGRADLKTGQRTWKIPVSQHEKPDFLKINYDSQQIIGGSVQPLHTSIQPRAREQVSSSAQESSIAELLLPQAGKTVAKRFSDSSSQMRTAGFVIANGQTPPIAWPVRAITSSGESIRALR